MSEQRYKKALEAISGAAAPSLARKLAEEALKVPPVEVVHILDALAAYMPLTYIRFFRDGTGNVYSKENKCLFSFDTPQKALELLLSNFKNSD